MKQKPTGRMPDMALLQVSPSSFVIPELEQNLRVLVSFGGNML